MWGIGGIFINSGLCGIIPVSLPYILLKLLHKGLKAIITLKHLSIRVYLYFLFILYIATFGLSMFLLAPLYKAAIAPNARWRDLNPIKIWPHVYRVIWRSLSNKAYRDMYPSRLWDPPKWRNDPAHVRVKASWEGSLDNCDACQWTCCDQIYCPMIDDKGRCLSYGSWYFGYLYCGRHPENQAQMDLYNCPKWEVRPSAEN